MGFGHHFDSNPEMLSRVPEAALMRAGAAHLTCQVALLPLDRPIVAVGDDTCVSVLVFYLLRYPTFCWCELA